MILIVHYDNAKYFQSADTPGQGKNCGNVKDLLPADTQGQRKICGHVKDLVPADTVGQGKNMVMPRT